LLKYHAYPILATQVLSDLLAVSSWISYRPSLQEYMEGYHGQSNQLHFIENSLLANSHTQCGAIRICIFLSYFYAATTLTQYFRPTFPLDPLYTWTETAIYSADCINVDFSSQDRLSPLSLEMTLMWTYIGFSCWEVIVYCRCSSIRVWWCLQ